MTANYGDETNDDVCEHKEWYVVDEAHDGELNPSLVCCQIKCESCGINGWLTVPITEKILEWNE